MNNFITDIVDIVDDTEKLKGYWDESGLDLHIAIKKNGTIAVSTKHWIRVHQIQTGLTNKEILVKLGVLSIQIGRKLIKSKKGSYLYINKLNLDQTQKIFNLFEKIFGGNIIKVWQLS